MDEHTNEARVEEELARLPVRGAALPSPSSAYATSQRRLG